MPPRVLLAGVVAALAGGVLAVAVSAHTTHYESAVNINPITAGNSNNYFYGAVTSDKAKCAPDRKVSVFQQQSGADLKFGSDTSLEGGVPTSGPYTVTAPNKGDIPGGDYYSKVRKRDLKPGPAHDHVCDGDKSPTVPVGP